MPNCRWLRSLIAKAAASRPSRVQIALIQPQKCFPQSPARPARLPAAKSNHLVPALRSASSSERHRGHLCQQRWHLQILLFPPKNADIPPIPTFSKASAALRANSAQVSFQEREVWGRKTGGKRESPRDPRCGTQCPRGNPAVRRAGSRSRGGRAPRSSRKAAGLRHVRSSRGLSAAPPLHLWRGGGEAKIHPEKESGCLTLRLPPRIPLFPRCIPREGDPSSAAPAGSARGFPKNPKARRSCASQGCCFSSASLPSSTVTFKCIFYCCGTLYLQIIKSTSSAYRDCPDITVL